MTQEMTEATAEFVAGLHEENRRLAALVASIPAIKANVRDACTIACAETKVAYIRFDKMGEAQRIASQACIDAIAELDLESL